MTSLPVTFIKQGGNQSTGRAIGRKGSQLLIAYTITDGSARERWIPANRIIELDGDIDTLPRWKSASCKAIKFKKPMTMADMVEAGYYVRTGTDTVRIWGKPEPVERGVYEETEKAKQFLACEACDSRSRSPYYRRAHDFTSHYPKPNPNGFGDEFLIFTGRSAVKLDDVLVSS